MRIWLTCNKLGVQFCDNILKPLECLAFFACQIDGLTQAGGKAADSWYLEVPKIPLWTDQGWLEKMKFDEDDHVGMIELQH